MNPLSEFTVGVILELLDQPVQLVLIEVLVGELLSELVGRGLISVNVG